MKMSLKRKRWIIGVGLMVILASFLLKGSFRSALRYRRAIKEAKAESLHVNQKIQHLEQEIQYLKKDPSAYETWVRRDLGYLRPGEKEIRFYPGKK